MGKASRHALSTLACLLAVAAPLRAQTTPPGVTTTSEYVTTHDGTRLAVDVHLPHPSGSNTRLPALLEDVDELGQSRYITEGGLRLLHRQTTRDTAFGIAPYHSFDRRDAAPMQSGKRRAGEARCAMANLTGSYR
ncbi:MAG: hypothetical protein ACT4P7_16370 [Gemmatimonadaceae bacterium]